MGCFQNNKGAILLGWTGRFRKEMEKGSRAASRGKGQGWSLFYLGISVSRLSSVPCLRSSLLFSIRRCLGRAGWKHRGVFGDSNGASSRL